MGRRLEIAPTEHCKHITANIIAMQTVYGLKSSEIAERADIGLSTFYQKMKKPETFTCKDISKIAKVFRCGMEDLVERRIRK